MLHGDWKAMILSFANLKTINDPVKLRINFAKQVPILSLHRMSAILSAQKHGQPSEISSIWLLRTSRRSAFIPLAIDEHFR
jgi:hypothetical protein